jgi:hypothetical protein
MKGCLKKREGDGSWLFFPPMGRDQNRNFFFESGGLFRVFLGQPRKKKPDNRTGFVILTNFKERMKEKKSEKT